METKLIKKLIETETLSSNPKQCLRALKMIRKEIISNEIPCFIKLNNKIPFLVAGSLKKATILFLNHIDVVPAKAGEFKLKQRGNKIFGRGVLDMKGPLVATLDSFLQLWKMGNKKIVFTVTSDEEIGGFNGAGFLTKSLFGKIKLAIIPDSTGNDLVIIQKAPFHIKIFSKGKSAHGSKSWEGVNAAENLLRCCTRIIANLNGNLHESTTATLTQFHSGEVTNMVPDKASAVIDIRIKQQSEVIGLVNKIETITKECRCEWEKIDEPLFFEAPPDNFFIKKWITTFKKITNKEVQLKIENGASDARFLWQGLKIPIIVTSAKGGGAHSDKEWVDINSLAQLSKTIIKFILLISKEKINSL